MISKECSALAAIAFGSLVCGPALADAMISGIEDVLMPFGCSFECHEEFSVKRLNSGGVSLFKLVRDSGSGYLESIVIDSQVADMVATRDDFLAMTFGKINTEETDAGKLVIHFEVNIGAKSLPAEVVFREGLYNGKDELARRNWSFGVLNSFALCREFASVPVCVWIRREP